jgi:cytochrome oxidase Cu insertion factor (SCO1/SenC/PrrC family)
VRRSGWVLPVLTALALISGCGPGSSLPGSPPPSINTRPTPSNGTVFDLPIASAVTALQFTNQDGKSVTLDSLKGQTVVLSDFLTLCQEICPLTTANYLQIAAKVKAAAAASKVTLLEVTVDPARDTVARLKAYQGRLGAEPNWQFWTASPADIARLWAALGVYYQNTPEDPAAKAIDWLTGKPLTYDVSHQDVLFVLGADGHEKWLVQGTPDNGGSPMPAFLGRFLNSAGKTNLASPGAQSWTVSDVTAALTYVTGTMIG